MSPKITVIIPVYNVERYLAECLDSVLNQTMRDIQIICVNDGSPDSSRAILQEYVDRDARIKIIDKPNGGQASARNAAYPHIKGKYTLFVDADDWIHLDLCEKTYRKAEETGASITVFFCQRWKERKIRLITPNDKTTIEEKLPHLDFPVIWDKLWQTNFLLGNNLYFPEGLDPMEDNLVNWQAVTLADKIAVVPERLYYYRRNFESTSRTWNERSLHYVPVYNKIRDYLLESGHYAAYRDKFISMKLDVWYRHYRNLPTSLKPKFMAMIRESLTADDREFYRDPNKQRKKVARLFYAMIDGGKAEAVKFRIAYTIEQIVRMPELLLNRWIGKPIKKWLKVE